MIDQSHTNIIRDRNSVKTPSTMKKAPGFDAAPVFAISWLLAVA